VGIAIKNLRTLNKNMVQISTGPFLKKAAGFVKLPAHGAGLPGKEDVSFIIAPLISAHRAGLAGCTPGQGASW
jgi:hypothetical protein